MCIYIYHILPLHIPYAPCMEYEPQHLPEQHHPNVGKYTMKKHGKKREHMGYVDKQLYPGVFFLSDKAKSKYIQDTHQSI